MFFLSMWRILRPYVILGNLYGTAVTEGTGRFVFGSRMKFAVNCLTKSSTFPFGDGKYFVTKNDSGKVDSQKFSFTFSASDQMFILPFREESTWFLIRLLKIFFISEMIRE